MKRFYRSEAFGYLLPPFICAVIMTIVYYIGDIAPFGDRNIVYSDMAQSGVQGMTYYIDVLRGDSSQYINWNVGAALNSAFNTKSPINVILLLFMPKSKVFLWMPQFIMIKMMIASVTAYWLLRKRFKISKFWLTVFAVLYAFSGYSLQYYVNHLWLDLAAMLPVLVLAFYDMIEKKRMIPYILALLMFFITTIYLSFMVAIFLFIIGGLYIILLAPAPKGQHIMRFGIGSVAALLLSAIYALPCAMQITSASRFTSTTSGDENVIVKSIKSVYNYKTREAMFQASITNKTLIIACASVLALIIVYYLVIYKKFRLKKRDWFMLSSVIIMLLPIPFENVNLLWHSGSYVQFPIRFGYIITLVLVMAAAYCVERIGGDFVSNVRFRRFARSGIIAVAVTTAICVLAAYEIYDVKANTIALITTKSIVKRSLTILGVLSAAYFICARFLGSKRVVYVFFAACLAFEVGLQAYITMAYDKRIILPAYAEHTTEPIKYSLEIAEELPLENDNLSRIKNSDTLLNSNYPMIIDYPSLSNWIHSVNADLYTSLKRLGYSQVYTRTVDAGGTAFTDALLNVKHTITTEDLDYFLSNYMQDISIFSLYSNKYTLPFGMTVSADAFSADLWKKTGFDLQNGLFSAFFDDDTPLFHVYNSKNLNSLMHGTEKIDTNTQTATYTCTITGTKALYLSLSGASSAQIYVNGKRKAIPSTGNPNNITYPSTFNNGMLYLGSFKDKEVSVVIMQKSKIQNVRATFGAMDIDLFKSTCESLQSYTSNAVAESNTLKMSVNNTKGDEYVFVPLSYDIGWSCKVNGKAVTPEKVFGAFMAVPISAGQNSISMQYLPDGTYTGMCVTCITIIILDIAYFISVKRKYEMNPRGALNRTITTVFSLCVAAGIAILCVIPVVVTIMAAVKL